MIRVKKPLTGPFADSKKPDRPNRTVSRGARFARLVRPGYRDSFFIYILRGL
jgi:hypothetical protein